MVFPITLYLYVGAALHAIVTACSYVQKRPFYLMDSTWFVDCASRATRARLQYEQNYRESILVLVVRYLSFKVRFIKNWLKFIWDRVVSAVNFIFVKMYFYVFSNFKNAVTKNRFLFFILRRFFTKFCWLD